MLEMIRNSDYVICNKDESLDCVKHVSEELKISKEETDREKIAKAIA